MKDSLFNNHQKHRVLFLIMFLFVLVVAMQASRIQRTKASSTVIDTSFIVSPTEQMIDTINAAGVIHYDHASVGSNTMNGLNNIIINSKQVILEDHARGNPGAAQKVADWKNELIARNTDGTAADDIKIAVFKWCYIDSGDVFNSVSPDNLVGLSTAINEIRNHANARVNTVKILILTVPLETYADSEKITDNTRIRDLATSYSGVWIYDIADFESRHANGTQCLSSSTPVLCSEYTTDGGHPSTAEGESRVGLGLFLSLYQVASSDALTPTPTPTLPVTLQNVYFTFGKLRYGRYASPSQLRSGDYIYLKNYDPKKIQLLAISLYDYTKKGNQCYSRTWKTSTSMYMRTCAYLPTKRKYAFIFTFKDTATQIVIKKYFVVNTISSTTITY